MLNVEFNCVVEKDKINLLNNQKIKVNAEGNRACFLFDDKPFIIQLLGEADNLSVAICDMLFACKLDIVDKDGYSIFVLNFQGEV